jgi:acyl carrier protein
MTNEEKYLNAFTETFGIDANTVNGLKYQDIPAWDSVGHMSLIAVLEDSFDIMMETEDIIDLSSYEKGKEILTKKYGIEF